jgi:hypothetical protein
MTTKAPAREMYLRPTAFEVASESKPDVTYRVQLPDCECPDFRYRRANNGQPLARVPSVPAGPFCKHLIKAFSVAGWQLPEKTTQLTLEQALEVLLSHGANAPVARAFLRAAQERNQARQQFPDGTTVLVSFFDGLYAVTF